MRPKKPPHSDVLDEAVRMVSDAHHREQVAIRNAKNEVQREIGPLRARVNKLTKQRDEAIALLRQAKLAIRKAMKCFPKE